MKLRPCTKTAKKHMEAIGPIPCTVVIDEPIQMLPVKYTTRLEVIKKMNQIITKLNKLERIATRQQSKMKKKHKCEECGKHEATNQCEVCGHAVCGYCANKSNYECWQCYPPQFIPIK